MKPLFLLPLLLAGCTGFQHVHYSKLAKVPAGPDKTMVVAAEHPALPHAAAAPVTTVNTAPEASPPETGFSAPAKASSVVRPALQAAAPVVKIARQAMAQARQHDARPYRAKPKFKEVAVAILVCLLLAAQLGGGIWLMIWGINAGLIGWALLGGFLVLAFTLGILGLLFGAADRPRTPAPARP